MEKQHKFNFDLFSAGFILVLGLATVVASQQYQIGNLAHMGPGYFPLTLGAGLVLIGIAMMPKVNINSISLLLKSIKPQKQLLIKSRGLIFATAGLLAFIILSESLGFLIASFALIFISALGDIKNSIKNSTILAAVISLAIVGIFHFGLNIQFPLFAW